MENKENHEDLDIISETPLIQRILLILDSTIATLFINRKSMEIMDIIWLIILCVIISSPVRGSLKSFWISAAFVSCLFIFGIIWSLMIYKLAPLVYKILFGKPVFGILGGMPRKTFFTALKCSNDLQFEFRDEDKAKIENYKTLDTDILEYILKRNYIKQMLDPKNPNFLEEEWQDVWNNKILNLGVDGITFRDSLYGNNIGMRILPLKLTAITYIISPFFKIFSLVMVYLFVKFLIGDISHLTVIQIGILSIFIISLIWFIHNSFKLTEIPFTFDFHPDEIMEKFSERIQPMRNIKIRPKKLSINKHYISCVRDYLAPYLLAVTLINSVTAIMFIVITLLMVILIMPSDMHNFTTLYMNLSIGILSLPIFLLIGYYTTFLILRNPKKFAAPIILGFLGVILPYIADFILTGALDFQKANAAIISFITGVSLLAASSFAELVKDAISDD